MGKYFHVHTSIFSAGEPLPHRGAGETGWKSSNEYSAGPAVLAHVLLRVNIRGTTAAHPALPGPAHVLLLFDLPRFCSSHLLPVTRISADNTCLWFCGPGKHLQYFLSKSKSPFLSPISDFYRFISSLHHVFLSIPPTPSWSSFAQLTS